MHIKIDALFKHRWPSEQHPGEKSGHMLHLLCHQGPVGTVCLQQDSDHMCLWPGYHSYHDTAKHCYCGVMKESIGEWIGTLLSSVMRVGSVHICVMDVTYMHRLGKSHLLECICHDTQVPPQASWCGGHQLELALTSGVSIG